MTTRILIVDADAARRFALVHGLRRVGYDVLTADDAVSTTRIALREQPHVILLDERIPGGDSLDLVARLRSLPASSTTPVIVCGDGKSREQALEGGAAAYLVKPVELDAAMESLRLVLGEQLTAASNGDAAGDVRQRSILVVDDDPDVCYALTTVLKASGYLVYSAGDAISATREAVARTPDLVILDVALPGGEGFVVMQRLRALPALAATPVIVISGRDPAMMRRRAEEEGAVAFLQKPADNRELIGAVRHALGQE